MLVDGGIAAGQYGDHGLHGVIAGDSADGIHAARVVIELAATNTGQHGGVALAGFQVFRGDFFIGVGLELKIHAPTQGGSLVVLHNVIDVAVGADDVKHTHGAFFGGLGRGNTQSQRRSCGRGQCLEIAHARSPGYYLLK